MTRLQYSYIIQLYFHLREALKVYEAHMMGQMFKVSCTTLLVRLAGTNSFQCMAWQPIHCEFVTGQCILPEREYVWQGRQVISSSSPKVRAFLKETYFWDNFDYNVRCYDFGYQENLDANFGRG